jgi:hypothetical protein
MTSSLAHFFKREITRTIDTMLLSKEQLQEQLDALKVAWAN